MGKVLDARTVKGLKVGEWARVPIAGKRGGGILEARALAEGVTYYLRITTAGRREPVSYTHLDVYKRQGASYATRCAPAIERQPPHPAHAAEPAEPSVACGRRSISTERRGIVGRAAISFNGVAPEATARPLPKEPRGLQHEHQFRFRPVVGRCRCCTFFGRTNGTGRQCR